jgi:thioredoxin 1
MINLTKENFKSEVEEYKGLVAIDLWATWCGPCKMIAPIFEELSLELSGVKFCKINVDEQPELTALFKVTSIPTIALVKDNVFVDVSVGYVTKDKLKSFIEKYV